MGLAHTTHHSSIVFCTLCTIGGTRCALSLGDGVGFIVGFKVGFRGTRCTLSLVEGMGFIVGFKVRFKVGFGGTEKGWG